MNNSQIVGQRFEEEIYKLLLQCCSNKKEANGLKRAEIFDRYDVLAENGIAKLELPRGSKIEIKKVGNPSNFKRVFLKELSKKNLRELVYIIDIEKNGLEPFLNSYGIKPKRIISYSELLETSNFRNNRINYKDILSKCLRYSDLADYLSFCIRIKIVSSCFLGRIVSSLEIKGNKSKFEYFDDRLTPFIFNDTIYGKRYLFVKDNRELKRNSLKNNIDDYDSIISIDISTDINESDTFKLRFTKDNVSNSVNITKINESDLTSMLPLYNEYLGYGKGEDYPIFKYRTFQRIPNRKKPSERRYKTRKEAISFINKNTYDSITNGTIWFSNKEQVNDPFDLDIRVPKTIELKEKGIIALSAYKEKQNDYVVFCTSRENNNILLWSHYGDNHKGICSCYQKNDLLDEIDNDSNIAICLYGEIEYLKSRPNYLPILSLLPYVNFYLSVTLFNIRCLFSKYELWSYEGELRFALVPSKKNSFSDGYGGIKMMPIKNYYGNRLDFIKYGVFFRTNHINPVDTFKLSMDKYELIPFKKKV